MLDTSQDHLKDKGSLAFSNMKEEVKLEETE